MQFEEQKKFIKDSEDELLALLRDMQDQALLAEIAKEYGLNVPLTLNFTTYCSNLLREVLRCQEVPKFIERITQEIIRKELSALYDDNMPRLQGIARECGFNVPHSPDPKVYRSYLLSEVMKQSGATKLIGKILQKDEYPNRPKLRRLLEIIQEFEAVTEQNQKIPVQTPKLDQTDKVMSNASQIPVTKKHPQLWFMHQNGRKQLSPIQITRKTQDNTYNHLNIPFWISCSLNIILVVVLVISTLLLSNHPSNPQYPQPGASCDICKQPIGGQDIGISDGRYTFDTRSNISDSNDIIPGGVGKALKEKMDGAQYMLKGKYEQARMSFGNALKDDASDGETHIYYQNANLLAKNQQFAVIVVVTMLTEPSPSDKTGNADVSVGRADLQGMAIEQEIINNGSDCFIPGCLKLYLMIANVGSVDNNSCSNDQKTSDLCAEQIEQQIVALSKDKRYKRFLGVAGWPASTENMVKAIRELGNEHILTVSPSASTDELTGISPYFFRVAPPDTEQGTYAAQYIEDRWQTHHVALFMDPTSPYSHTLASSFYMQFTNDARNTLTLETFQRGNESNITNAATDAHNKDQQLQLIYFAGSSSDFDTLHRTLYDTPWASNIKMMGGDALYNVGDYQPGAYNNLFMTTFAFPDTWDILGQPAPTPFFSMYGNTTDNTIGFGATWSKAGRPYGYTRADSDNILSYDAIATLIRVVNQPSIISDTLQTLTSLPPYQGASGQIKLGLSGNPINKAVVVLCVDSRGRTHLVAIYGHIQDNNLQDPQNFPTEYAYCQATDSPESQ